MNSSSPISRKYLLVAVILVIGLYVLVPQIGDFKSSWHLLSHPRLKWLIAAILFTASTYLTASLTYCLLAFHTLAYWRTVVVQLAVMFINRLLPGGIGALGANYVYLTKHKHTSAQAATMVAVNNLLGFVGHNILVVFTLLVYGGSKALRANYSHSLALSIKIVAVIVLLAGIFALVIGQRRLGHRLAELKAQLSSYRQRPWRLLAAQASSILLTLGNVLCLFACAYAVNVHLSFAAILLVFTLGIGAGTATPTPGGLGGFEAGLVAGLVAYGVHSSPALSVALLYRLVSYWLPLIAGAGGLVVARERRYI
jgi:undecaprenyl-diphosphatase